MNGADGFLGHVGDPVPSVNVADMKALWQLAERIETQYGSGVAVASNAATDACSPGADIRAVGYRSAMLRILNLWAGDVLAAWKQGEHFHEAVFIVLSTIPMTWVGTGTLNSLPFDLDLFLEELRKQTS